jgi:3-isopropylmalate dehydrogenase
VLAAICAGGMMLETLGEVAAGKAIEAAVVGALSAGKMGLGTREVGDLIASSI